MKKKYLSISLISTIAIVLITSFFMLQASANTIIFTETRNPGFVVWENAQSANWAFETALVTGTTEVFAITDYKYKNEPIGMVMIAHRKPSSYVDPTTGETRSIGSKDTLTLKRVTPVSHTGFTTSQVQIFDNNPINGFVSVRIQGLKLYGTGMYMEQLNLHNKGKIVSDDRYTENWHVKMNLEWEVNLFVDEGGGDTPPNDPPIDLGSPPTVKLFDPEPNPVKAGDPFCIRALGYSFDGTIEDYMWSYGGNGSISGSSGCGLYFMEEGTKPISVTVIDDRGQTASDYTTQTVLPPTPVASFSVAGTLKENRTVDMKSTSTSPMYFPIDWTQSYWEIRAIDSANQDTIRYRGDLINQSTIEALFKKAGNYEIDLYVKNTAGYSSRYSDENGEPYMIAIVEDLPPVANFSALTTTFRDANNANKATIEATDQLSVSTDDDYIQQRIWQYRYDSNNDGNFEDEEWVIVDQSNLQEISFEVESVGYYQLHLEIVEGFGQPTLLEFIVPEDYRKDNTTNKPLDEQIIKVDNKAPEVEWVLP